MLVSFSVKILSVRALAFADLMVAARKSSVISSLMEKRLPIRISKTILRPVFVIILQLYALKTNIVPFHCYFKRIFQESMIHNTR
jgi:hypothetical protein